MAPGRPTPRRLVVAIALVALALVTVAQPAVAHTAPGTWTKTGSLNVGREFHTATLLHDGRVLVAGGLDASGNPTATAELFHPRTRNWTMTTPMNVPRVFHTATLLSDGKVLVTGGRINASVETATAELFDPATGTWSLTGPMNTVRAAHTATLLANGKVLVAGGQDAFPQITTAAEIYDPTSQLWTNTGSMNTARYQHTATLLTNGRVLVAGGIDHSFNVTNTAEIFNPADGTWTNTQSMSTARYVHAAARTLLQDGKVLVCGGLDNNNPFTATPTAELFDPSGTWSPTTTFMTRPRYFQTATLLPGGKILVAGGAGGPESGFNRTKTAELFDPATGIWKKTGSMHFARYEHTATVLTLRQNGHRVKKVLVVGGSNGGPPLNSAELYALP